jgi:hypothetical protein
VNEKLREGDQSVILALGFMLASKDLKDEFILNREQVDRLLKEVNQLQSSKHETVEEWERFVDRFMIDREKYNLDLVYHRQADVYFQYYSAGCADVQTDLMTIPKHETVEQWEERTEVLRGILKELQGAYK